MLPTLESFGEIQVSAEVRAKLLTISASHHRPAWQPSCNRLRLGPLAHQAGHPQAPDRIRTFADWDEREPGLRDGSP